MGKLQSKQECFYLSPELHTEIGDHIWNKKTGFHLSKCNIDESMTELSICLEDRTESSPLRVDLPPRNSETEASKLLKLDHVAPCNHDNKGGHDRAKMNIEEFECGVQFQCSENAKQEWAFTLYDFNGHGRITREDLASLLKALYDTVGSSIKLPPNGAKTLKLRLTVGQETMSHLQEANGKATATSGKGSKKIPKHKAVRELSKLNNLSRASVKRANQQGSSHEVTTAGVGGGGGGSGQGQAEVKDLDSIPGASHASGADKQAGDLARENLAGSHARHIRKHQSDCLNDGHRRHKRQHRAAGLHCPTTSAYTAVQTSQPLTTDVNASTTKLTEAPSNNTPKENLDRRSYYHNLAGVDSNNSKILNNLFLPVATCVCPRPGSNTRRSKLPNAVLGAAKDVISSSKKCDISVNQTPETCDFSSRLHEEKCDNLSRLPVEKCDITNPQNDKCLLTSRVPQAMAANFCNLSQEKCDNLVKEECERAGLKQCQGIFNNQQLKSKSLNVQECLKPSKSPKTKAQNGWLNFNGDRFRPASLPGQTTLTVLPDYHRRHRHREKDRHVMMQQVAEWIEREHVDGVEGNRVVVTRHEHRHIHEHHHHHHFHHHYDT